MTKRLVSAFPNAYVDVVEPLNNSVLVKALALVGMIGIAYIGLTTLILDFAPTGYDPVRQVISPARARITSRTTQRSQPRLRGPCGLSPGASPPGTR